MTKIILIRHGETDWNREQVFRGRNDVPLNAVGLAQARAVRDSLKHADISVLYASPLSRAIKTASTIGEKRDLSVNLEEGVIDIDFGTWQGLSHQLVKEKFKDLYEIWMNQPHSVRFPEGESLDDVQKRSLQALERIVKNNPGKTVALVSHRVVNKVLLCTVLGLELSRFWYIKQDTCAVNRFEYKDGEFYLTLLNDICHLTGIKGAAQVDF
jgi:broad specificity phosphatase PhoE